VLGETKDSRRAGEAIDICFNKSYMSLGYLSTAQQCNGCPYERRDLFSGTTGLQLWQWYCGLIQP
jgi:hypothetical protein